jgi:hypothetical protein
VHKAPAHSLGLKHDYVHSKILADNNIKPESFQRRIDLDAEWKKVAEGIRQHLSTVVSQRTNSSDKLVTTKNFMTR